MCDIVYVVYVFLYIPNSTLFTKTHHIYHTLYCCIGSLASRLQAYDKDIIMNGQTDGTDKTDDVLVVAVVYAIKCASVSVTRVGSQKSYPILSEL